MILPWRPLLANRKFVFAPLLFCLVLLLGGRFYGFQPAHSDEQRLELKRWGYSLDKPLVIGTSPLVRVESGTISFSLVKKGQPPAPVLQQLPLNWIALSTLQKVSSLSLNNGLITFDFRSSGSKAPSSVQLQKMLKGSYLSQILIVKSRVQILRDTGSPIIIPIDTGLFELDLEDRGIEGQGVATLGDYKTNFALEIEYADVSDTPLQPGQLSLSLKNDGFNGDYSGLLGGKNGLFLKGEMNLTVFDRSLLSSWLNNSTKVTNGDAPKNKTPVFTTSGQFEWSKNKGTLKQAAFVFGDNYANGTLSLTLSNHNSLLEGSLAFKDLDVSSILQAPFEQIAPSEAQDEQLTELHKRLEQSSEHLLPFIQNFDADLRLSAQRLKFGSVMLEEPGFSLFQKKGVAIFDMAETALLNGRTSGHIKIDTNFPKPRWHVNTRFYDIELEEATKALRWTDFIQGKGTVKLHLTSFGDKWAEIYQNMYGALFFDVPKGGQLKTDFNQLLVAQNKSSKEEMALFLKGKTQFSALSGVGHFAKGALMADYAFLNTSENKFTGKGRFDLQNGVIDWHVASWPLLSLDKSDKNTKQNLDPSIISSTGGPALLMCSHFLGDWERPLLNKYTVLHLSLLNKGCPALYKPQQLKRHDETIVPSDNGR